MTIEHQLIADPYRHEPKGISAANSGDIYVANGAGSGVWTNKKAIAAPPVYGSMEMNSNPTATGVPDQDSYVKVAGTFNVGPLNNVTFSSNELTVGLAGVYLINFGATVTQSTGSSYTYLLTTGINGTAVQFGPLPIFVASGEVERVHHTHLVTLAAGDIIYPMITNSDDDSTSVTVSNCHFVATLVRNI